jgi:hypothetical protein
MEIPPKFHHEKIPNPKNHPESKPKKARPWSSLLAKLKKPMNQ